MSPKNKNRNGFSPMLLVQYAAAIREAFGLNRLRHDGTSGGGNKGRGGQVRHNASGIGRRVAIVATTLLATGVSHAEPVATDPATFADGETPITDVRGEDSDEMKIRAALRGERVPQTGTILDDVIGEIRRRGSVVDDRVFEPDTTPTTLPTGTRFARQDYIVNGELRTRYLAIPGNESHQHLDSDPAQTFTFTPGQISDNAASFELAEQLLKTARLLSQSGDDVATQSLVTQMRRRAAEILGRSRGPAPPRQTIMPRDIDIHRARLKREQLFDAPLSKPDQNTRPSLVTPGSGSENQTPLKDEE